MLFIALYINFPGAQKDYIKLLNIRISTGMVSPCSRSSSPCGVITAPIMKMPSGLSFTRF